MLVPMTKVRLIARRGSLDVLLEELHRLGLVEIVDPPAGVALKPLAGEELRTERRSELRYLLAATDALLALLPAAVVTGEHDSDPVVGAVDADAVRALLAELQPEVERLTERLDRLHDEEVVLPRYLEPLRRLVGLVPELADLDDEALARLRLDTIALVLDTDDDRVVETLRGELTGILGDRFELVSTRVEHGAIGCVVVFPHEPGDVVHELLGREHVRHVALPSPFAGLSLRGAVEAMAERLAALPQEIVATFGERRALLTPRQAELHTLRTGMAAELEQLDAHEQVETTGRTVVALCWVPRADVSRLRSELEQRVGPDVVVELLETSVRDREAPVLMHNIPLARPFERLVSFLDLPRHGTLDPTVLTALFLPLMFGVMVGDVGYGAILLVLAFLARRHFSRRSPVAASLSTVLLIGAGWAIVFGVLFGELFGDLGKRLWGDWAVWMYRPGAEALEPLLLFAIAIGAAHVVLGLVLGLWQAARFREHRVVLDKVGTLLVLVGLFALAGWAVDRLPGATLTPAVAAIVVGLVLVMSLHGVLGMVMGPLELVGTLGNVLSYLRLAAVGLASAYLAIVANELAVAGPIWLGIIIALFFHTLNLALAAFSPTIQALRLHYVEFFSKFLDGGGKAFRPFGRPHDSHT